MEDRAERDGAWQDSPVFSPTERCIVLVRHLTGQGPQDNLSQMGRITDKLAAWAGRREGQFFFNKIVQHQGIR